MGGHHGRKYTSIRAQTKTLSSKDGAARPNLTTFAGLLCSRRLHMRNNCAAHKYHDSMKAAVLVGITEPVLVKRIFTMIGMKLVMK